MRKPPAISHVRALNFLSFDVMTDPRTGVPHYTVRVRIPPEALAELKGVKLFAGMQCSVTIKTGARTMLTYLLRPLLQRTGTALLEH